MERFDSLILSLTAATSRRNVITAMTGGVFGAALGALSIDRAGAKKHAKRLKGGKHKRGKHKHRRKRKDQQQNPPPPPPPPADPVIRADATCASSGSGEFVLAGENDRLAQTFTALASGLLVRADLDIASPTDSAGDFVLQLSPVAQSGETFPPTNDVLAEATMASGSVPADVSTIPFSFGAPFSVVTGVTYALVLSRPGGDGFFWSGSGDNACAGAAFVSQDLAGSFADITPDLVFTAFVSS